MIFRPEEEKSVPNIISVRGQREAKKILHILPPKKKRKKQPKNISSSKEKKKDAL